MNYDEIKEENMLDEALNDASSLSASAKAATEINDLVAAGKAFAQAVEIKAAHDSLERLLQKFPSQESNKQSFINSFLNRMKMPKIFALRPIGTIVAVLLFALGGLQIIQNLTTQSDDVSVSGGGVGGSFGVTTASEPASGGAIGLAQDEGIVERATNAVRDMVGTNKSYSESVIAPGMPYPVPPDYYGAGDIRDTREYLKTSYFASLKALHPNELAERAQITVRGLGGRVDNASISERNSYISFVLPKDKFEEFRSEIKTFVNARFITENISSQNLLPQKQNIEQNTASNQTELDKQTAAKKQLDTDHAARLKNLNAAAARLNSVIVALQAEAKTATDSARLEDIAREISDKQKSLDANSRAITAENSQYKSELASINNQIDYYKNQLTNLAKQDVGLSANVETVQGSLSFTKITYSQMLNKYLGGYLSALVFAMIGLAVFFLARRGKSKIEVQPVQ